MTDEQFGRQSYDTLVADLEFADDTLLVENDRGTAQELLYRVLSGPQKRAY